MGGEAGRARAGPHHTAGRRPPPLPPPPHDPTPPPPLFFPGTFSDSNLLLLPWEPRAITFTSPQPFDVAALQKAFAATSLADTATAFDASYFRAAAAKCHGDEL